MAGYVNLKDQLKNKRSQVREAIFHHKLIYDLKVAALDCGQTLQAYCVEVDDVGYDLILDWGLGTRKFQVKSRMLPGGAKTWQIQAGLLRPTPQMESSNQISEWQDYHPFGIHGGVILIDVDWQGVAPIVTYGFTDHLLLMCMRDGFVSTNSIQAAGKVLSDVRRSNFNYREKVSVPVSCLSDLHR
jgi:hypothetical protein